jgi:hypothetical protein
MRIDVEEAGHIDVVREGGRQTDNTDHTLGALHLSMSKYLHEMLKLVKAYFKK